MERTGIVARLQGLLKLSADRLNRPQAAPPNRSAERGRNEMSKTDFPHDAARHAAHATPAENPALSLGAAMPVFLPAILRIWEAQQRIEQGGDPERALVMVRRHIDRALAELSDAGFELRSYEGQQYDPGMRAIVPTTFREDPDVSCETVGKTGVPAVFFRGHLIAKSRAVILAPPVPDEADAEPESEDAEVLEGRDDRIEPPAAPSGGDDEDDFGTDPAENETGSEEDGQLEASSDPGEGRDEPEPTRDEAEATAEAGDGQAEEPHDAAGRETADDDQDQREKGGQ